MTQRVFGIVGWKNSGKTTLTEKLVIELSRRGWKVSTIKHTHHDVDLDQTGTDSFRHRAAGAHEVALISSARFTMMHEARDGNEPGLQMVLERMSPCDLVLIEGYKHESHGKIETRRSAIASQPPLSATISSILAVASDTPVQNSTLPVFDIDDVRSIADFVEKTTGLT